MKIKPEYTLSYEEELIYIMHTLPDGTKQEICPLSDTAAMAWEGFERGIDRASLIEAISAEFSGVDKSLVAADLDVLAKQLVDLGYAEED